MNTKTLSTSADDDHLPADLPVCWRDMPPHDLALHQHLIALGYDWWRGGYTSRDKYENGGNTIYVYEEDGEVEAAVVPSNPEIDQYLIARGFTWDGCFYKAPKQPPSGYENPCSAAPFKAALHEALVAAGYDYDRWNSPEGDWLADLYELEGCEVTVSYDELVVNSYDRRCLNTDLHKILMTHGYQLSECKAHVQFREFYNKAEEA